MMVGGAGGGNVGESASAGPGSGDGVLPAGPAPQAQRHRPSATAGCMRILFQMQPTCGLNQLYTACTCAF